jgi:hypothetical protein
MLKDLLFIVVGIFIASAYPQVIPAVKWGLAKAKAFLKGLTA